MGAKETEAFRQKPTKTKQPRKKPPKREPPGKELPFIKPEPSVPYEDVTEVRQAGRRGQLGKPVPVEFASRQKRTGVRISLAGLQAHRA